MGKEKDYREQIDRSVKRLAKALNIIEALHSDLEFVFEHTDWNSEVNWQIEEMFPEEYKAAQKLRVSDPAAYRAKLRELLEKLNAGN